MNLFTFNIVEIILLASLGLFLIIQVIYYFSLYNQLHAHNKTANEGDMIYETDLPPVSVIISARNESENLQKNLPYVLEQDYPNFEVIVINDGSTDESEDVLTIFEEKYTNLYHTFTPDGARYISRKKLAITLGIKASKHNWLVFTDADCRPASNDWLKLMARNFSPRTDIVLGYSGYEQEKGWFQRKVAFSNLFMSMRYLGFALINKPYMAIGRNMAYRKELFFKNKGFSSHLNLQRGDDDLFINEVATPFNTRVETSPNAVIRMEPAYSFKSWKEEKVSYLATSHYYHGLQRYWMGFETTSRLLFITATIAAIVVGAINMQWIVLGIAILAYILRYVMQAIIINQTAADFGEKKYYLTLPLFDIIQPLDVLNFKLFRKIRGKADYMKR
ncbi:glycosyltransferase [uncultured Bacteroides sp.]|uniref:glycosyltransferase n=1 Tax=uncultured Bacteroides sp. TaxID=162156 RepID=UPI002AAC29A2|nr:glycosyltransferase [uncultured Bacteroides sp.]